MIMGAKKGLKPHAESIVLASWVMSLNQEKEHHRIENTPLPDSFGELDFLDGDFDGVDGKGRDFNTIHWSSKRLLNGWVIRDEIREINPSGEKVAEKIVVRTYSSDLEQWKAVQLDLKSNRLTTYSGSSAGNTVVMESDTDLSSSAAVQKRQLFIRQGDKRFTVIEQFSTDDGETWSEERRPFTLHKIM